MAGLVGARGHNGEASTRIYMQQILNAQSPSLWNPQPQAISPAQESLPNIHAATISPSRSLLFCPRWLGFRMASGGQRQPVIWVGWPLPASLAGTGPAVLLSQLYKTHSHHLSHVTLQVWLQTWDRTEGKWWQRRRKGSQSVGLEAEFRYQSNLAIGHATIQALVRSNFFFEPLVPPLGLPFTVNKPISRICPSLTEQKQLIQRPEITLAITIGAFFFTSKLPNFHV